MAGGLIEIDWVMNEWAIFFFFKQKSLINIFMHVIVVSPNKKK